MEVKKPGDKGTRLGDVEEWLNYEDEKGPRNVEQKRANTVRGVGETLEDLRRVYDIGGGGKL